MDIAFRVLLAIPILACLVFIVASLFQSRSEFKFMKPHPRKPLQDDKVEPRD